ncbi:MAG TPA: cytochrome D1 domain-containing protein [Candidatus Sulfotelmatobacter sp.]|nr:cytochrome D1 domain-containing protein [Candidatus Sulfotelmatobacter sp.]
MKLHLSAPTPQGPVRSSALVSVCLLAVVLSLALGSRAQAPGTRNAPSPSYLTPVAAKISPDGIKLYVVCEDADAVLAVDLPTQRVIKKVAVGHKPKDLAVSPDGKTLYVSNEWSDTVSVIDSATFQVRRTLATGWGPRGLTTDRAGKTLYVANSIGNDVSVLDLTTGAERKRLTALRSPHYVQLSRDGRYVYVSNILAHLESADESPISELMVIDTRAQTVAERILIPEVLELRHVAEAPGPQGGYLLVPFLRPKNLNPLIQVDNGWILTHGVAVIRPAKANPGDTAPHSQVTQLLLDDIDRYYAGADGVAFTPDGRYALVTHADAATLSVIDTKLLAQRLHRVSAAELPNRLDTARQIVVHRLSTQANPTDVVVAPNGRTAYVVNRLDDSLTVVDIPQFQIRGRIDLGGPKEITALRQGEQLFHDAKFCFQGQFACATCHPDNHIDGVAWNLETPQLGRDRVANRTLRGIAETAPFKWNGHNPDLETQCGPRIAKFLFHSEGFNHQQLENLVAFIKSIPLPPNRHLAADGELTASQDRGRTIFFQKGCDTCHPPESHYTAKKSFDVGTAAKYDTSGMFDVPQLDRIYEKPPYLHNGEARTLEEIWTIYNPADRHGFTSDMSKEQLNDLVEFLKTL